MAYICGLKQRIYAELWDTLFQGTGNLGVQPSNEMFMRQFAGSHLTNMTGQGQLASDNTFVVLGMASTPVFYTIRSATNATIQTRAAAVPLPMSANDVQWNMEEHVLIGNQLLFTLMVGEKPEWQGQCRSVPAAQGISGAVSVSAGPGPSGDTDIAQFIAGNGVPSYDALLRLAKPAIISPRQQFKVLAQFASQTAGGAAAIQAVPVIDYLNSANATTSIQDYKSLTFRLLGTLLRHVL